MRYLALAICVLVSACSRSDQDRGARPADVPSAAFTQALAEVRTYPRFEDSDPHAWDGRRPASYPVHGVDVSRYQGEIDWRRMKRAGVSFAYIKATEGGDVADPQFLANWRGASRAGMRRGAYHYYYFCRSPEAQARWFIRNVPRSRSALPPVLDIEWNHSSPTCKRRPSGAQARREAQRFLRMIEAHYGRRPLVYTTVDFYRDTGIGRLQGADFWLRSVAGHPRHVYPGARWVLWQYSGTGRVPGVEGDVDLNAFVGSPNDWLRWLGYDG